MKALPVLVILLGVAACRTAPHAYLTGLIAEPVYDVQTLDGQVVPVPNCERNSVIIGAAYRRDADVLYARVAPGNQVVEFERSTGDCVRSFTAERVEPGCGLASVPGGGPFPFPEVDPDSGAVLTCGLTVRWSDGHLFLDQPNAVDRTVVEVDPNGAFVREITYESPAATAVTPVTGLGYHQDDDRLWILFVVNRTIAEYDLDGRLQRQLSLPGGTFQPNGLAIDTERNEIIVPGMNGTGVSIYDFQGNLLREFPLNRGVAGFLGGGVGAGPRR